MMEPHFINGLQLSQLLYQEAVRPVLEKHFPGLCYAAALIGPGSEVLGFDTPQSTDHDWGPSLLVFLEEAGFTDHRDRLDQALRRKLPGDIHGYPVDLAYARRDGATDGLAAGDPAQHGVTIHTVRGFFSHVLHVDIAEELRAADWLTFTEQALLSVTSGRVFHDGLGQLEAAQDRLRYYPHDVWLYLLAAQWRRIAQEEAFLGRCGQAGDELGSRLVASRLVRDLMRLCFLMERRYAPYIKWFGTAFQQLACSGQLTPLFEQVLSATDWREREKPLCLAYEYAARMHNDLGITEPLPASVLQYYERPFLVIQADRFVDAIRTAIITEEVLALPEHLGSVDTFVDSTDALNNPDRFRSMYL